MISSSQFCQILNKIFENRNLKHDAHYSSDNLIIINREDNTNIAIYCDSFKMTLYDVGRQFNPADPEFSNKIIEYIDTYRIFKIRY